MKDRNYSIKTATIAVGLGKYTNLFLGLIANAILARILNAEEYGIVAVLMVFVTFFQLFTDMGFGAAVIQNKELDDTDISNIFSFTIYLGIILTVLFMVFSNFIAFFYNNPIYKLLGKLIALSLLFSTWNMIPNAMLLKRKRFSAIGVRTAIVSLVSYVLAILLAYAGWSYYSLIFQSIFLAFFTFLWNVLSSGMTFRWKIEIGAVNKIRNFSINSFIYDIINYFSRNLDNLLTGKIMGDVQLGYYSKAYQLTIYPNNYFSSIISSVLHPILSEYQNQKKRIYEKYVDIVNFLLLAGAFVSAFFFVASEEIVLILYGNLWVESIPAFKWLSLSVVFQMTTASCTNVFRSINKTDLRLKSAVIYVPIQVIMIIMGTISQNIETLSIFVAVSFFMRFLCEMYYLIKLGLGESLSVFFQHLLPGLCIYGVGIVSMIFLGNLVTCENIFLKCIVKGIVLTIVYLSLVWIFKQEKYLMMIFPKRIKDKLCKIIKR